MDPITLIVTALAAGATAGLGDTVSQAIRDAYGALKSLVRDRIHDRPDGDLILDRHEQTPEAWRGPLAAELKEAGVRDDDEVVERARRLLELIRHESPAVLAKYDVDASGSQGVQIGDHGTQHNTFSNRPDRP